MPDEHFSLRLSDAPKDDKGRWAAARAIATKLGVPMAQAQTMLDRLPVSYPARFASAVLRSSGMLGRVRMPLRLASFRLAPSRFAPTRSAFLRFAQHRFAQRRSAPGNDSNQEPPEVSLRRLWSCSRSVCVVK